MRADWVDGFVTHTENISSPSLFCKWAAIGAIAGALERKVWVKSLGSKLYPNFYIIFVAPPGVGKTELTWRVRDIWQALEEHHIAATSVTKASLIDELADANRRVLTKDVTNPVMHYNSLLLCINELGVLIPAYENEFMNTMTDLWDCKHYSERRRSSGLEISIDAPQLNLIAGCTPSYLMNVLPEGAWDQGFLSRTMLIYSGDRRLRSLFEVANFDEAGNEQLKKSLIKISELTGEIKFTAEAAQLMDEFHLSDGGVKPDHPKLISYNIRRTVHLIKLCMVAAVSRSDEMVIREEDFHRAIGWMLEAEQEMPEIFKAMSQGGAGKIIEETWYFLFTTHAKEKKPVAKHRLINFLQERVPAHNIETTIDMMVKGKLIKKELGATGVVYTPAAKKAG